MIHLPSLKKDVEIATATRKIQREIQEELLRGVEIGSDGSGSMPALNMEKANEKAVMLLTGLTQSEVDSLSVDDYETLVQAVNDVTKNAQKKTNK